MTLPKAKILTDRVIGEQVTEGLKTEHSYFAIGEKVATAMLDSADTHYQAEHLRTVRELFEDFDKLVYPMSSTQAKRYQLLKARFLGKDK